MAGGGRFGTQMLRLSGTGVSMHTERSDWVPLPPFASIAAKTRSWNPGGRSRPKSAEACHVRSPSSDGSGAPTGTTQYPVPRSAKRTPTACASVVACPARTSPSSPCAIAVDATFTSVTRGLTPPSASADASGCGEPGSAPGTNWPDSTRSGSPSPVSGDACSPAHDTARRSSRADARERRRARITSPPATEAPTGPRGGRPARRANRSLGGSGCGRTRRRAAPGRAGRARRAATTS